MGTDIHGVFQRRDPATGQWEDVPSTYEQHRDYQLFAVLAGVRNGYGAAGVTTGEPVKPIASPRGLPDDFRVESESHPVPSVEVLPPWRRDGHREGEPIEVWMGDHSHSWLTGDEMLRWFATAPVVTRTGILSRSVYEMWSGDGPPESWCGGIAGPNVKVVHDNAVEMAQTPDWTHVRCHWYSPLRAALAYLFDEVARLVKEHGEVRFVFGFDS